MKLYSPSPLLAAMGAATVLLAACGDGSSLPAPITPPTMTTEIPGSATTSSAGAFTFVNLVASTSQDTAEPLLDGDSVLATSDTDEPDPSG